MTDVPLAVSDGLKGTGRHFPNDRGATKLLYLALYGVQRGWRAAPLFWPRARTEFAIRFGERLLVGS